MNQLKEEQLHALTEGLASTHQAQLVHERRLGRTNTASHVSGSTQESGVLGDTRLTGGEGLTVTNLTSSSEDPSSVRAESYGQSGKVPFFVVVNIVAFWYNVQLYNDLAATHQVL